MSVLFQIKNIPNNHWLQQELVPLSLLSLSSPAPDVSNQEAPSPLGSFTLKKPLWTLNQLSISLRRSNHSIINKNQANRCAKIPRSSVNCTTWKSIKYTRYCNSSSSSSNSNSWKWTLVGTMSIKSPSMVMACKMLWNRIRAIKAQKLWTPL